MALPQKSSEELAKNRDLDSSPRGSGTGGLGTGQGLCISNNPLQALAPPGPPFLCDSLSCLGFLKNFLVRRRDRSLSFSRDMASHTHVAKTQPREPFPSTDSWLHKQTHVCLDAQRGPSRPGITEISRACPHVAVSPRAPPE